MPVKYEKHLYYVIQASVILDFDHTNNRGLLNSPPALPFNHCLPGKSWAHKEEQNHKNTLRTGMATTTAHGNTVLPMHKVPQSLT